MELKEILARIGQRGTIDGLRFGDEPKMRVGVEVINAKLSYGKARYHVRPISGEGAAWVEDVKFAEA